MLAALTVAALVAARSTEGSSFCGDTCHEMGPYYATWQRSSHKDVPCVRCHIKPGAVEFVKAKTSALREVYVHVAGQVKQPIAVTRHIPNSTCESCHLPGKGVDPLTLPGVSSVSFSHKDHARVAHCIDCHSQVVHRSTPGRPYTDPRSMAFCFRCHTSPSQRSACQTCHKAPHEPRGRCVDCHQLGTWRTTFTHPVKLGGRPHEKALCEQCHTRASATTMGFPAGCIDCHTDHHRDRNATLCAKCHVPTHFVPSTFDHPKQACARCHQPPHPDRGACVRCHDQKSWASDFRHPTKLAGPHSSFACERCHTRGFNAPGLTCSSCHNPPHPARGACDSCHSMTTFASAGAPHGAFPGPHGSFQCERCHTRGFNAPGLTCSACHTPPHAPRGACGSCHSMTTFAGAGAPHGTFPGPHASFSCGRCHTNGFNAPGRSCVSCHGSRYGGLTACASCHTMRSFSPSTFHHPSAGEHSSGSFACTSCHPNGSFGKAYCSCHGGKPPQGD